MNALRKSNSISALIIWPAVALAIFTSVSYLLMAVNLLGVGDLQMMKSLSRRFRSFGMFEAKRHT